MSKVIYDEASLHAIFANRLQMFEDMYNSSTTESEKSLTVQKMVRYILFNYISVDIFATEIENYIAQIGNDPTHHVAVLSLVSDVILKARQTVPLSERYKPIITEIAFKIAESKKKSNIEMMKNALLRFVKKNIYSQEFIDDVNSEMDRRAMKNSKDILLAGNIFLNITNELTLIKRKRMELGDDPKHASEIKSVVKQEMCQRDKFIEFHTHQMTEIGNMLTDVDNELKKMTAKAEESVNSQLYALMGAGLDDDDEDDED